MPINPLKKSALFLVLLVFATFTACDDEPLDFTQRTDPEPEPEEQLDEIVGDWNLTDVALSDATGTFDAGGNPTTIDLSGISGGYDVQLTFEADNTVSATGSYLQTFSLQLGLAPAEETVTINASDLLPSGTWSRTSTLLTITSTDQIQEIALLKLDETTLILELPYQQMQVIENLATTVKGTLTLTFEKL